MRPGLPDPLIDLLGARWHMGAPACAAVWFGDSDAVGFGLADGTVAVARAGWNGAPRVQPRQGGGVELVPATAAPPPVMRLRVHDGPCLAMEADGAGVLSGGGDGLLARVAADGRSQALASFRATPVTHVAALRGGAQACAAGATVHRFGVAAAKLDVTGAVTALAVDPAGQRLAIGHRGGVTLWADGAQTLTAPGTPAALAWGGDGRVLIAGLAETGWHGWTMADGREIVLGASAAPPLSLAVAPAGASIASSGETRVVCWDIAADGIAGRRDCGVASTAALTRVACHPRRSLIAAGYANGAVLLCQPDSSDILFVRAAGGGGVAALAWSADGTALALATEGGEIGVVGFPALLFRDPSADRRSSS